MSYHKETTDMATTEGVIDGNGRVVLDVEARTFLKALLDKATPSDPGGRDDWEGDGRRYAEYLIGMGGPCTCEWQPGCAEHGSAA